MKFLFKVYVIYGQNSTKNADIDLAETFRVW